MGQYQVRRRWVKQQLSEENRWPTAQDIIKAFPDTSRSAAYRDLDSVLNELLKPVEIEKLRVQVFERIKKRLPEIPDGSLVKLTIAFLPRLIKGEVEAAVKGEMEVKLPELKGLAEDAVTAIVENFLEDEARKLRQAKSEPV